MALSCSYWLYPADYWRRRDQEQPKPCGRCQDCRDYLPPPPKKV